MDNYSKRYRVGLTKLSSKIHDLQQHIVVEPELVGLESWGATKATFV